MEILAAMFAYLGCVTGIVAALTISFFVFFSAPDPIAIAKHPTAMASAPSESKIIEPKIAEPKLAMSPATAPEAKPPAQIGATQAIVASGAVMAEIAPQPAGAANARPRGQMARAQHLRRLIQEERARRWAYQQDPDFESRFLGYAD